MQYYDPSSFIPNVHQNQDPSFIANAHREAALYHLSQMNQHRARNEVANQRDTYNSYANPENSRKRQYSMLQSRDAPPPNAPSRPRFVSRPTWGDH